MNTETSLVCDRHQTFSKQSIGARGGYVLCGAMDIIHAHFIVPGRTEGGQHDCPESHLQRSENAARLYPVRFMCTAHRGADFLPAGTMVTARPRHHGVPACGQAIRLPAAAAGMEAAAVPAAAVPAAAARLRPAGQDRTSGLRQRLHAGCSSCVPCVSWASGHGWAKFLILRRIAPGLCGLIRFSSVSWSLIQNYARRRGGIIFIEFY